MNAMQFIKEHGVDKAREVVEGAPDWATGINLNSLKYFGGDCFCGGDLLVSSLKGLVESVDLVNLKGGVKKLKKEADCLFHNDVEGVALRYEQAIADYEQLFGNTETLGLEILRDCDTSPNCKKFDEMVK